MTLNFEREIKRLKRNEYVEINKMLIEYFSSNAIKKETPLEFVNLIKAYFAEVFWEGTDNFNEPKMFQAINQIYRAISSNLKFFEKQKSQSILNLFSFLENIEKNELIKKHNSSINKDTLLKEIQQKIDIIPVSSEVEDRAKTGVRIAFSNETISKYRVNGQKLREYNDTEKLKSLISYVRYQYRPEDDDYFEFDRFRPSIIAEIYLRDTNVFKG
ncbi:hypothetical protein EXW38_18865 [Bacillus mycoides]|uniref:hypothetical protein n=1 Tax=Bacillus mycoides TaxID=1405 RepID=UPI001C00DA45|nr:hypothetical protein [Bacillus mycoides]QWH13284.1 hypothetical protein EXW38_18865 [Bacillus mycoides]